MRINEVRSRNEDGVPRFPRDISLHGFADVYLRKTLGYSVDISPAADKVTKRTSIGVVGLQLSKTLLVASAAWGCKFYVMDNRILVRIPNEDPPHDLDAGKVRVVFAEPLPRGTNLRFAIGNHMCGPNCLALIAFALGRPVSVERVAELADTDPVKGTSIAGLAKAAEAMGLSARGMTMPLDRWKSIKSPVIIHLEDKGGHYVVLGSYGSDGYFSIMDPPVTRRIPESELRKQYSGRALFVWTE